MKNSKKIKNYFDVRYSGKEGENEKEASATEARHA